MKLYEAIESHLNWKNELAEHIRGGQEVDPARAHDDAACALGRWIVEKGEEYGSSPAFHKLCEEHIAFHTYASAIAAAASSGDTARATALMDKEFSTISRAIVRSLAKLRGELGDDA